MSDDAAIQFQSVTKEYRAGALSSEGIKSLLIRLPALLREHRRVQGFRALDDVTFHVRPGECFGVIGRNGSGKSTTLGLIAGVLRPDVGEVRVRGRIAPLLELGAGFHPYLSGRENIQLNGVLLGLTLREVRGRMESIIEFSELGSFIDRPLRTYSSGMIARLGFSVAVHLDPEVLLVDEVLAVGDEGFHRKCFAKMEEFRHRGVTIVYVSHNLPEIQRICDRAAMLEAGKLVALDVPKPVIAEYLARLNGQGQAR